MTTTSTIQTQSNNTKKKNPTQHIFVGFLDGRINKYDLSTDNLISSKKHTNHEIKCLVVCQKHQSLFASTNKGGLLHYNSKNLKCINYYHTLFSKDVKCLSINRNNRYLLAGSFDGCFKQIDIRSKKVVKDFRVIFTQGILEIKPTFDNQDSVFISSCAQGKLVKFNMKTHTIIKKESNFSQYEVASFSVCLRLNLLFLGDAEGKLKVISTKDLKLIKDLGLIHKQSIYSLAISNNDKFVFSSCVGTIY